MKEKSGMPIVGMSDYGFLATIVDFSGKQYLCSPHIGMERMVPENCIYFCMQNDSLSPLEMFRILMWNLHHAVIGGYESNVEDTINFLKTNGVTMRPGEIKLIFKIEKDTHKCYKMWSYDDRDIRMEDYDNLKTMASAFYHVFEKMSMEFDSHLEVVLRFMGEDKDEFASILEYCHDSRSFDFATLN